AGGENRIVTEAAREADVGPFAVDLDLGIAEVAGHASADCDWEARLDELGCLLDVHLDPGGDIARGEGGLALAHRLDVGAALLHGVPERPAVVGSLRLEGAVREDTKRRAGADVGDLEPDALLGSNGHGGHVTGRTDPE